MDRNRVRSLFVDRCGANFFVDGERREKEEREEKGHAWCARTRNDVVQVHRGILGFCH